MNRAELVKEWFEIALVDLRTARHLFETMCPQPLEIVCYHCQQAVEKVLKAFLVDREIEPPRIHDLERLCLMCVEHDQSFVPIQESCRELTAYAVSARYPSHVEIEEQDAVFALKEAERIYTFCSDLIPALRPTEKGPTLSQ